MAQMNYPIIRTVGDELYDNVDCLIDQLDYVLKTADEIKKKLPPRDVIVANSVSGDIEQMTEIARIMADTSTLLWAAVCLQNQLDVVNAELSPDGE